MAPRAIAVRVACLALLCSAALVDARSARKRRAVDSNLIDQPGASDKNLCKPLRAPAHGTIACGAGFPFYSCTASCNTGYRFPGGLTSDKRECDQMFGEWFDPPGMDIPDCEPVCNPPCANGGTCLLPDTCTCANGFMGAQCQYPASNCANPPNPRNGLVTCQNDTSGARCTVTCNTGFKPLWAITPTFKCSPDGTWAPLLEEIPDCVSESTPINTTHVSSTHPSTGSARCTAWGQDHYRTFDNKVYHYKGSCQYVLVKDAVANTFNIYVINDKNCQPGHRCKRELDIFVGNDQISLRRGANGPVVTYNGAPVAVPSNKGGIIFEEISQYMIVRSSIGFQIRWDGYEMIFITLTDDLRKKTKGLCGTYDGDQSNDFTTDTGAVVTEEQSFVSTWKRSFAGETCADVAQTGCSAAAPAVVATATSTCEALNGAEFQICHHAVPPEDYIRACKEDCCAASGHDCLCSSLEAYSRACLEHNINIDWRSPQRCPAQCPGNQIHKECGSMCQKTCQSHAATCEDNSCIDGCFCPDGKVLHNNMCVQQSECPCVLNGREYQRGAEVPKECNKCTCDSGAWQCTNKRCEATCSAIGDPHYMTFDGTRFDFMGQCSYYMIYDKTFDVITDNIKCGHGEASCTKSVSIDIGGHHIKMDHNHQLFVDGVEITSLPFQNEAIKIFMVSSLFMKAELSNGITILWDGRTRAYVTAPPEFINKTMGLCGTYDFNQKNDFKTKEGDIETTPNAFGNRWKTIPTCKDAGPVVNPCDENVNRRNQSAYYCEYLKSDVFRSCADVVDVESFYHDCMFDVCACTENLKDCLCPILGEYAAQCGAAGIEIKWRNEIAECHLPCNGGQEYQVCPNECTRTCSNLANDKTCVQSSVCAEGCGCPVNQTLDNGNCIPISQCPCVFDGQEFAAGVKSERGDQICVCLNAQWACAQKSGTVHIQNTVEACSNNSVYTTCVPECPMTCENMRDPKATSCNSTVCREGCVCQPGYVREGKECVLKSDCPCKHGGISYKEGETFSMDCNECTCRSMLWVCEQKECPAVCSAYGDSHYTTFDGKSYEFQGTCDYVFAKSTATSPIKFEITTENLPCGTTGVTCTRSISFSIGEQGTPNFYRIQLVKGKPVVPEPGSPFNVQEVGNFIIITTPQGITLEWDKGTQLYLKLSTEHKGQVVGLCGNFNGNQKDDFTTPQGGPPATRPTAFADSWKVHAHCGNSKEITDTCSTNTERRAWSQQQCGIIASRLFEPCHRVVAYQPYVDRCVFDACACDTGGDCECMCTAVAAYAHVCAMNGISVKWRTEDMCPIMCENCMTYNPCISICPKKTCDNRLVYDSLIKDCGKETCVEGCDIEPCPTGQLYESNKAPFKCIPEAFCNTTCLTINGKEYKEGERITDATVCRMECEVCYCDNNQIKRTGVCSSTTSPVVSSTTPYITTTTPLPTLPPQCVQNGPTAWMSVSAPTPFNQGDIESISDLRAKYTFCDASQMTAIECRVVGTQTSSAAAGQRVFCDLRNGLKCYHSNQAAGEQCLNYEVRVTCNCGLPITTTIAPNMLPGGSPTPRPRLDNWGTPTLTSTLIPPPMTTTPHGPVAMLRCKEPGWSNWMNSAQPSASTSGNDVEFLPDLMKAYEVCKVDQVAYIQCRRVSDRISWDQAADSRTVCSTKAGFACYGSLQQGGICEDYEIRVYCQCLASACDQQLTSDSRSVLDSQFTASSSAATYGPAMARLDGPSGWKANAGDAKPWLQINFGEAVNFAGLITQGVKGTQVYTKSYTLSYSSECNIFTDYMGPDGKPMLFVGNTDSQVDSTHILPGQVDMVTCVRINPVDFNVAPGMRVDILGCRTNTGISEVSSTTTPPPPLLNMTTTVSRNMTTSMPYTCTPGWSEFMSIDTPSVLHTWEGQGLGDIEPLSELRKYYSFCANPSGIQCRVRDTRVSYTMSPDFETECSLEKGFVCLNSVQAPMACLDYEVSVNCDCGTSTPTPTPTTTGGVGFPLSPKPFCGWTDFMNSYVRTGASKGDYETIHNLRMKHEFCEFPVRIECREVGTHRDFAAVNQAGVTCDINHGLVCEDKGQTGAVCKDYEVRLYCIDSCTGTTLYPPLYTGPSATQSPAGVTGGSPTLTPPTGLSGTPTAYPPGYTGITATQSPPGGSGGSPTLSPPVGASGTPTAYPPGYTGITATQSPPGGSGGSPTLSPPVGASGTPTAYPPGYTGITATQSPPGGSGGSPTLSPPAYTGKPTAYPPGFNASVPTQSPSGVPGGSPTLIPPSGYSGQPTTTWAVPWLCKEGWTDWINIGNPSIAKGDFESYTNIPGYPGSCDELIKADCAVASTGQPYMYSGQDVICDLRGLQCVHGPMQTCLDYKIRFFCSCHPERTMSPTVTIPHPGVSGITPSAHGYTGSPTMSPPTEGTGKPTVIPPALTGTPNRNFSSDLNCTQGWTKAMSVSTPSFTGDDLETIADLRKKHAFCGDGNIVAIRCTGLISEKSAEEMGQKVTCDVSQGLLCYGAEQAGGKCEDYAVQVYCDCMAPPQTTTLEPPMLPGGVPTARPPRFPQVTPTIAPTTPGQLTVSPRKECDIPIGVADQTVISGSQLTASTAYNFSFEASNGRLMQQASGPNGAAWLPRFNDKQQFIQVDLGSLEQIAGLITQGRPDTDQWVESFFVETSIDGTHWYKYADMGSKKEYTLFAGNFDRSTQVRTMFDREIDARFVRIVPQSWYQWIALRFEILSCYGRHSTLAPGMQTGGSPTLPPGSVPTNIPTLIPPVGTGAPTPAPLCLEPMGVDNALLLRDGQLTASSGLDTMHGAAAGRLYNQFSGWAPATSSGKQWIQVDLLQPRYISGVLTQGLPEVDKWARQYVVSFSKDGYTFTTYSEAATGEPKVFEGNYDRNSIVKQLFRSNVEARYVRITVVAGSSSGIGLRLNLIGCFSAVPTQAPTGTVGSNTPTLLPPTGTIASPPPTQILPVCTIPMGIGNHYIIGASQITASSSMGIDHLKNKREATGIKLPWTPEQTDVKPWIQVDFLEPKTLSGVITLGSPYKEEWVTSYQVFTSMDGKTFVPYSDIENGTVPKTFEGNTDNTTEVTRLFNRNIVGRYIRIYPITWHVLPTLMFEILGCNPTEAVNMTTVAPGATGGLTPTATPPIGGTRTPTVSPPAHSATPTPKFGETVAPPTQPFISPPKVCLTPMGMEYYGTVLDKQISSSSELNVTYGATSGRIYDETAWIPRSNDTSPWIQINFEKPKLLSGVQTQGEHNGERWVTKYTVEFSMDGITYYPYADKLGATHPKEFTANHNSFDVERHLFNRNVTAQYIRIHPLTWHGSLPALRLNVLGCNPDNPLVPTPTVPPTSVTPAPNASSGSPTTPGGVVTGTTNGYEGISTIPGLMMVPPSLCDVPMGIENHLIVKDIQLSASSSKDQFTGAERARLYSEKDGSFSGGWMAGENNLKQYIQVDFLAPYYLGGIVTQGRADAPQWVTRYEVYYSTDGRHFSAIPKSYLDSSPMVFSGNSDKSTPVAHKFPLISARWIRIHPVEWHGAIAMRFNVLGCMSPSRSPLTTITATTPTTPTVSGVTPMITGAGSTSCAYWTPWVSASKPDKQGEYESAWQLRELITFCDYQYITRTECRTTGTHIQYDQAGESGLICNNELKGLLCYAKNQTDGSCLDYEIRMFCDECSSPTTPRVTPEVCSPKWLPWINKMIPTTDMNYVEHEFMTVAKQRELCPNGKLTRIECVTTSGIQHYSTGSIGTTCDVTSGLTCRNSENYPIGCEDFKVRYYCECEVSPTQQPSTLYAGTPTVSPPFGSGATPTASPLTGSGGSPTASPNIGGGGSPTLIPPNGGTGTPTASPLTGSGGSPTVSPNIGGGGSPTLIPPNGSTGTPTASPLTGNGGSPTASPNIGGGGSPTLIPPNGGTGTPTASPLTGSGGSPTASPNIGGGGSPTLIPPNGGTGTPTASPLTGNGGSPTASPNIGGGGSPTLIPPNGGTGTPTASPLTGSGGSPTVSPNIGGGGSPTLIPPNGGTGTPTASPLTGSGGSPTASPNIGGGGSPTLIPPNGGTGTPTASPLTGNGGSPTASPNIGGGGSPTLIPPNGGTGTPTASPLTGSGGSPTVSPNIGGGGSPTLIPPNGGTGTPTASPLSGSGGSPTASPNVGGGGSPTLIPPNGGSGTPTASPLTGSGGTPTVSPNIGGGGSPTLIPPNGGTGTPTASPLTGSGGSPTASPNIGGGGSPTLIPPNGGTGTPTASPLTGSGGSPTASPNIGGGGSPTIIPPNGGTGTPTASPQSGSGGSPTAQPHSGSGASPTVLPPTVSGSPTIGTTPCVVKTEWSTWYNRHTPTPDTDEIEGMSGAEKYAFCGSGTLLAVECQTINNIPFFSTGDFGTVCNISHGLICSSTENFPVGCNDYMIRYQCQSCEGSVTQSSTASTTHSPTVPGQGTPTLTPHGIKPGVPTVAPPTVCATTTQWSSWINRDKPGTGTGDTEVMTGEEKMKFCPTGTIVTVECQRSDGTPHYDTMDIVDCNPVTGLTCDNDVNMGQCGDYMIRYQCEQTTCGVPTTASTATPPRSPTTLGSTTIVTNNNKVSTGTLPGTWHTGPTTLSVPPPSGQSTTAQPPAICETVSRLSMWIDRLHPTVNTDEHEFMTREELMRFCARGVISKVECQTTTGQSLAQSPDFATCSKDNGLVCSFLENFPMGCQDYRVRYECQEQVCQTPTAHPQTGPGGVPTASPGAGSSGSPTASPPIGNGSGPTAHPPTGSGGVPTASPGAGISGSPTASPPIGNGSGPTAHPPTGPGGVPTASPGAGSSGSPTASPPIGNGSGPTAHPPTGSGGIPTASPGAGSSGSPTASPPIGNGSGPTAHPPTGSGGVPSASPGAGISGSPTASPPIGNGSGPTAHPPTGNGGVPTASPGAGISGSPTASPPIGNGSGPTAHPPTGNGGVPTASPGAGISGSPTASPPIGNGSGPTAHPPTGNGGVPTASPGAGISSSSTASPPIGNGSGPTAHPPTGNGGVPTASPGAGISGSPTASPPIGNGSGPTAHPPTGNGGVPTASPGAGISGSPTASPPIGNGSGPTAHPPTGNGGVPTASPGSGPYGNSPTIFPPTGSGFTPAVNKCTKSHFSSWINRDKPVIGNGDFESFSQKEKEDFCVGGVINRIECVTSEADIPSYSAGEIVKCEIEHGLVCRNEDNSPIPCSDYKIRYFCDCNETFTSVVTPGTPTTTENVPIEPTFTVRCGWSPWLNGDRPNFGTGDNGDLESIASLKSKFGICKNIVDISCRVAGTNMTSSAAGQKDVTCDVLNGLRCYNRDQIGGACYDYEVSVLCWGPECTGNTATLVPGIGFTGSPSITAVCPPGQVWEACAYKCGDFCEGFAQTTGLCSNADNQCVPMCRIPTQATTCQPGELLRDKYTCVQQQQCPCVKPDGTVALAYETWAGQTDCSICQCANNQIRCSTYDNCTSTTSTSTLVPPKYPGITPTIRPVITHPDCGWTAWINTDRPTVGAGDLETISKIRQLHSFCVNPVMIECRDTRTQTSVRDSSQKVTCDLVSGLKCLNWDNGAGCNDYEVRFYCPCVSTLVSNTPTAHPPTESGGSPSASPNLASGGVPTASPSTGPNGAPTAHPPSVSGGVPTASPGQGGSGFPTAYPPTGSGGAPTAHPPSVSGGAPTASPGQVGSGFPTAYPPTGSGGAPTAHPPSVSGGAPTASPGQGGSGSPTAYPPTGSGGAPTAHPPSVPGGSPSASPNLASGGVPTASPSSVPNGAPTAHPPSVSGGSPTASPGQGGFGSPTAYPPTGSGGAPTAHPPSVSGGAPTASPGQGGSGSPTAYPPTGSGGAPTAHPPSVPGGSPSASPNLASGGIPTVSPSTGPIGAPTAHPPTGNGGEIPTAKPVTCGWTTWIDGHKPDENGESELFADLRRSLQFCADTDIQGIECRVKTTHQMFNETDQIQVLCDINSGGLMCFAFDQPTGQCYDYEIRVFCEPKGQDCSNVPTARPPTYNPHSPTTAAHIGSTSPPITSSTARVDSSTVSPAIGSGATPTGSPLNAGGNSPTAVPPGYNCTDQWSIWYNRDNTNDGKEMEFMTEAEKRLFCPYGTLTAIECVTTSGIQSYSTGEILECSLERGLLCNDATNFPVPCQDYKVRYFCKCNEPTTQRTTTPRIQSTATVSPPLNISFPVVCQTNMGVAVGGAVADYMISASSSRDGHTIPVLGRLNSHGAWTPLTSNVGQYLQVDFLTPQLLTGLVTQGREGSSSYVTSYKVMYSLDGYSWTPYQDLGRDKVFSANKDGDSHVTNWFEHPIRAQFIRILPQTWHGVIAMRLDILGCFQGYQITTTTPTSSAQPPTQPLTVKPPKQISGECIVWDQWVNEGHLSLTSGGDSEPIATIQSLSKVCTSPVAIECARASDELPYNMTGQRVKCDLWNGLSCFNADNTPLCYDYKARLGCLKNSPECLINPTQGAHATVLPVTNTVNYRVLPCFEGLDLSACPKDGCADGLYCDGVNCVRKDRCPCLIDGKIVMSGGFKEGANCDTCQCIAGEVMCTPKMCAPCPLGFSLDNTNCSCSCVPCPPGEFKCGNGMCIPLQRRCDGVIDCIDDEKDCVSTPLFTPPTGATATPTLNPPTTSRYHGTPTVTPPSVTGVPTGTPVACTSKWSSWLNRDKPNTGDGDREVMTQGELATFCPVGKITAVECQTVDGIASYSTGEVAQCTMEGGSVCLNGDNDPIPCSDYQIRYYCKCEELPTLPGGHIGSNTPTLIPPGGPTKIPYLDNGSTTNHIVSTTPTEAPVPCTSQWSSWINTDTPDSGDGDRESWTAAQRLVFCPAGKITAVECQTVDGIASYSTGEVAQCTMEGGSVCLNGDNDPIPCSDYQIRYYCTCEAHPTNPPVTISHGTPTPPPGVTTRTTTVTVATPYRTNVTATATGVPLACVGAWSSWINTDTPDGDGDVESWSAAQKSVFCPMGKVTSIECATVDGIASYSTGEIQQCTLETGSRCMNDDNFPVQCSDYKIRYFCDCKVQPTLPATVGSNTPTLTPHGSTQNPYKQLTTSQTPLPCTSQWSSWINKDKPDTGDGDRESWTAAQRSAFCPAGKITAVECQTVDGIASYSTGEVAQCTMEGGSVCLNADNDPIPCSDYQIRYYCTCESLPTQKPRIEVTPSTTGLPPTVSRAPTTSHGHGHETAVPCLTRWGRWINRDHPDTGPGDREVMSQHELSTFCAGGRISAIDCRTVDDIPSYSTGEMISCTINHGLECRNDDNAPVTCSDYKIRYSCECEQAPPMVTTGSPMALHRTPMHINQCELVTCPVRPVVKEGEEVQEILIPDGCCREYKVVCNPMLCTQAALQCPPPMSMIPANTNDCCPTFQCTCPPICPAMNKPTCGEGMEVVIIANKCNCTSYACAHRPPVKSSICEYVMNNKTHTYNVGQYWHDGLCKFCKCIDRPEGAVTSCEEERCPMCKLGFKQVPRADQCCDHCEEIGCVVNGTVYKAGDYIPSTRDCYTKTCNFDANLKRFIVSETQVMCPKYDLLRECLQEEETYDPKGCCMRCVPKPVRNNTENLTCQTCAPRLISGQPNDTIGYFTVMDNLELCKNNEPIPDLLECSGYCNSHSSYSHVMRGFTNDCNCCQATATESKSVELTCKGGRTISKTYSVPKSCGCGICTGGK
ncbi:mucin-5AC-like isoform X9 [Dreissena polymorpha]|uniref:mucin-5AC-like isoform X9 n=1 Tax=Dreissena polymorpha TaxID=45954 RepID=UPI0022654CE6|nr:mucin-5AC-like isoform X9 [Dreissena polymorpha]